MKTTALIEKGKDGTFSVYTPELESTIIGEGPTASIAKADFETTYHEICEQFKENNESIPAELEDLTFEYRYDLASLFSCYDFINVGKFATRAGINPSLMRQYRQGNTYISAKQLHKIEAALHECGRYLIDARLSQ